MKRNLARVQVSVFAVIAVAVLAYSAVDLFGFHLTDGPFPVTVRLDNAGGIFQGAEVAYRGVSVGRVKALDLATDGVTLTLDIDHGTRIPANSVAKISALSAAGEQYVDFEPPAAVSTEVLHVGSVIPERQTTTPLRTAPVLYDLDRFLKSLNPEDLQTLGREGALAVGGLGPQLKSLLADTTDIVSQLSHSAPQAASLIGHANILLSGAAAHSTDFDRFSKALSALTATLAQRSDDVGRLIKEGSPASHLVTSLLDQNTRAITVLLANAAALSQIQADRVPALRALLLAVPYFGETIPHVVQDGALKAYLTFNFSSPICSTGVRLSNPLAGRRTPLYAVSCPGSLIPRGAANAPRPPS